MLTGCMPCILRVDKLNNIGRIINMITVNAIGDTCPIPVVKTKKAIEALTQPDTVETLVDNEIAVENLKKMAAQKGYSCDSNKLDDGSYSVKLTIETLNTGAFSDTDEASQYTCRPATDNRVVVIRSSYMGEGSEELGILRTISWMLQKRCVNVAFHAILFILISTTWIPSRSLLGTKRTIRIRKRPYRN